MSEIRAGQKIKLCFKTDGNSEAEFDCFIKEVFKDRLSLAFSGEIMRYINFLDEGKELQVKTFTPLGVKVFTTMILNSPLEDDFVIEYVEDSIQIQRREHVRVFLNAKIIIIRECFENISTKTVDISGGGLRFFYEGNFYPQESVEIFLYLPSQVKPIKAVGTIQHNEYLPKNEHVLLFTSIDEKDRDIIIKQCFNIQRNTISRIK